MSGSDYKSNSEKYTSRSIKLGELKSHLSNDTYNTLKNLLDSLEFDEFDILLDAYSRNFSKKNICMSPSCLTIHHCKTVKQISTF